MKDYYKILNVNNNASSYQIRNAYIKLAKQYHPDVNPSPSAKKNFQEILEAYQVLKNDALRKEYDYVKSNIGNETRLKEFLSKVASIEKLAEILTMIHFYQKLNAQLTGTGATAGLSAGAYWGARAGGIPGAIIGGAIGGIVGAIGGKTIGKTLEKIDDNTERKLINEKIIRFIESQPETFQKGISEILITNFEHPNITYEKNTFKNLIFGTKSPNSYNKDKNIMLNKAIRHIRELINNDSSFELVSEYVCYLKKYSAKSDLKLFEEKFDKFQNKILLENNAEKQKELNEKINKLNEEIRYVNDSINGGNSDLKKFLYSSTIIISIIIYLIIVLNSEINPLIPLIFFIPIDVFLLIQIHEFSIRRLEKKKKELEELKNKLEKLEDELNKIRSV